VQAINRTFLPRPLPITEDSLIDLCDLLTADRVELSERRVCFVKRQADGSQLRWSGHLGDHLVACGEDWRITSELAAETTCASVA